MSNTTAVVSKFPSCQADFCKKEALYDAKTKFGPWGYFCETHFKEDCIGLGLGKGQKLVLESEVEEKSDDDIRSEMMAAIEEGDFDTAFDLAGDRDPLDFL